MGQGATPTGRGGLGMNGLHSQLPRPRPTSRDDLSANGVPSQLPRPRPTSRDGLSTNSVHSQPPCPRPTSQDGQSSSNAGSNSLREQHRTGDPPRPLVEDQRRPKRRAEELEGQPGVSQARLRRRLDISGRWSAGQHDRPSSWPQQEATTLHAVPSLQLPRLRTPPALRVIPRSPPVSDRSSASGTAANDPMASLLSWFSDRDSASSTAANDQTAASTPPRPTGRLRAANRAFPQSSDLVPTHGNSGVSLPADDHALSSIPELSLLDEAMETTQAMARALSELSSLLPMVESQQQGISSEVIAANTLTMQWSGATESGSAACSNADAAQMQCMVCLEDFRSADKLRVLPCFHRYHCQCVEEWLARDSRCPICKHNVVDVMLREGPPDLGGV